MRKAYVRVKLPEEIVDYVAYVVDRRLLGYRSMIEFVSNATRKEVMRLRRLEFIPPVVPKVKDVPVKTIGILSAVVLAVLMGLLGFLPSSITGFGVWDDVFSPLAGWNVGQFYARYQGFLNFGLYFVVFFAILFSVTKKWLDRREAIVLAGAFSLALSIGLALMPVSWLQQLSPIALLVIALVLLYAVFEALKHLGFAWISSGSIAFILAYLLVRTHRPDLFAAAGPLGPALNVAFLVAFFIAILKAGKELWGRSQPDFARAGHAARLAWSETLGSPEERALIAKEQGELTELLKIEPKDWVFLKELEGHLARAEQAIRKYGYSKDALSAIGHELLKLRGQETELTRELETLQQVATRAQMIDVDLFSKLKKHYDELPSSQKKAVKKVIEEKVAELNLDAALPRLAQAARDVQSQADTALQNVITELERNQAHNALTWLYRTRYYTAQLRGLLTQVNDTREAVQALAGKSLKYFTK